LPILPAFWKLVKYISPFEEIVNPDEWYGIIVPNRTDWLLSSEEGMVLFKPPLLGSLNRTHPTDPKRIIKRAMKYLSSL